MKDQDMTCHWVGNPKIKPIDVDELFDGGVIIDILESNLNDADEHKNMIM